MKSVVVTSAIVTSEVGAYNLLYKSVTYVSSDHSDVISRRSPGALSPVCSLAVALLAAPQFYGRPAPARLVVVRLYGSGVYHPPVKSG